MTTTQEINQLIQTLCSQGILDTSQISDSYHTFGELYEFKKAYNAVLFNEWASKLELAFTDNINFYGWNISIDNKEANTSFKGIIKNKSELIKVLKQLNINV